MRSPPVSSSFIGLHTFSVPGFTGPRAVPLKQPLRERYSSHVGIREADFLTWEPPELTVRVSSVMTARSHAPSGARRQCSVGGTTCRIRPRDPLQRSRGVARLRGALRSTDRAAPGRGGDRPCVPGRSVGERSLNGVIELFDSAAKVMGDPCLGLHFAESFHPRGAGLLGHLSMSAPTVRDAMACAARCVNVYATKVMGVSRSGRRRILDVDAAASRHGDADPVQYVRRGGAGARAARRRGARLAPAQRRVRPPRAPCVEEARKMLGERVRFSQPANVLVDRQALSRRCRCRRTDPRFSPSSPISPSAGSRSSPTSPRSPTRSPTRSSRACATAPRIWSTSPTASGSPASPAVAARAVGDVVREAAQPDARAHRRAPLARHRPLAHGDRVRPRLLRSQRVHARRAALVQHGRRASTGRCSAGARYRRPGIVGPSRVSASCPGDDA